MPGLQRKLDVNGDYVADGKGSYVKTSDLSTPMRHQLQGQRNRWVGDFDAGSDLYQLEREGNSVGTPQIAADMVRRALKPFMDRGEAANLDIITDRDVGGRFGIQSTIHDLQHGEDVNVTELLPGGP